MGKAWCGLGVASLALVACGEGQAERVGVVLTAAPGSPEAESTAPKGWAAQVAQRMALGEYQLRDRGDGSVGFTNRAQDLRARVDGAGATITSRSGQEPWQLTVWTGGVGRGADIRAVSAGSPRGGECSGAGQDERGRCLVRAETMLGEGITEWWANDRSGLRQGWVVGAPPAGTGDLTIDVGFVGFEVSVRPDGRSADLISGGVALAYDGLTAWDATGLELPARMEDAVGGVRIAVDVADAVWPVTVDPLVSAPSWSAEGNQAASTFGYSLSGAGDVNGDGYDDVIVGAADFDNGEFIEGRAYVFHGSAEGLEDLPAWIEEPNVAYTGFGGSVSGAGDVNGDGYDDVIVGGSGFNSATGRVFVFHGSLDGLGPDPSWIADGSQTGGRFGRFVSDAGDVNHDGYDDIVVGSPLYDGGQVDEGRAYVWLGAEDGLQTDPVWIAESNQAGANFGSAVSGAGDVNGDGYDDVIVGAHLYTNGQDTEGRAYVFHGFAGGLGATAAWITESDQEDAQYGYSVSGAGDVNGDGYDDVIVGAPRFDDDQSAEGRAFVYHGNLAGLASGPAWTAESDQAFAQFGWSVSGAGDIEGDGYDDVIVGAQNFDNGENNEGRAFAYRGGPSGLDAAAFWTAESNQAHAIFGVSVSDAGDVNGDGYDDVVVGARHYENGEAQEGGAFLYLAVPPAAAVAGGPYSGSEGLAVSLDASGSIGTIWRWDCTDDGSYDTTGETAICTYPDDGQYTVRLQVEDASGETDEDTATVTVGNVAPEVAAGPNRTGVVGIPVAFTGSATDVAADPLTYRVDCGAGAGLQTVASTSFSCTYASPAVYTVTLEADDGDGGIASDTATATITAGGYCDGSEWLCQQMPELVADANAAYGSVVVKPSASAARLRPATVYATLDTLATSLEANGCVVTRASLETSSGAYNAGTGTLWGSWSGGAVTGAVGPGPLFVGSFVGGEDFGTSFGRYNGWDQLVADRADGGFVAGRHVRGVGNRGVWFVLHGTCDAGNTPPVALDPWWVGSLAGW